MATSPTPTGNPMSPVSPAHSGIVSSGGGGGGGGMEELLPLVLQLTNPDQVSYAVVFTPLQCHGNNLFATAAMLNLGYWDRFY